MMKSANVSRMTEKQVTRAYFQGRVTEKRYRDRLVEIATRRHARDVGRKKQRNSMSSSKWR